VAFSDDNGGFSFSCDDAKFSIGASTWNTRLSQIGKILGTIRIMTNLLPNPDYISKIISKRPNNILIIANYEAREDAQKIKNQFPNVRIALHPKMNAKVVFIEPETVWISSSDFGETKMIESAIGLHSVRVHDRAIAELFKAEWEKSVELAVVH
jgi:hypothetical protein